MSETEEKDNTEIYEECKKSYKFKGISEVKIESFKTTDYIKEEYREDYNNEVLFV